MKATDGLLEIEVDGPLNESLHFHPLGRSIRGRFDLQRTARHDADAAKLFNRWPVPIVGQRLGIDLATGTGYLLEPLYDTEHAATREKIQKTATLPPERQEFPAAHVPTWLYWLKRAIDSGLAKLVRGELPDKIDGEPRKSFIVHREKDPTTRLAEALEAQTAMIAELLKRKG